MCKQEITFDKLPQAITYLTLQVAELKQLLSALQPLASEKHQLVGIDDACRIIQKAKPTIYASHNAYITLHTIYSFFTFTKHIKPQFEMTPERLIDNYLPADYQDTYSCDVQGQDTITPDELFNSMMLDSPKWVDGLMKIRDTLVKPFGLQAGEFKEHVYGMIQCRNERELVWGMNDRHLLFYASMWCTAKADNKQTVGVTTIVKYNNTLGKIYFFFIRPFHKFIIKSQLQRVTKKQHKI